MASLDQLLGRLDIDGGKSGSTESDFADQLDSLEFSIFRALNDVGFFAWKPSGDYKALHSIKSKDEILRYIDMKGKPDRLKPTSQIVTPKRFMAPEDTEFKNKFPYSEIDIACIHVAVKVCSTIVF